jgi:hypothetical protein
VLRETCIVEMLTPALPRTSGSEGRRVGLRILQVEPPEAVRDLEERQKALGLRAVRDAQQPLFYKQLLT